MPSLKRSARTRSRKPPTLDCHCPSTSLNTRPLDVIHEISQDEESEHAFDSFLSLYPSSRHPTGAQTLGGPKPRTTSNISVVDFEIQRMGEARLSAYEFSIDDNLLMPPRSAPSPPKPPSPFSHLPPTSSAYIAALSSSPDSFRLTFTDSISLDFPHLLQPPSPGSSPSSNDSDLPTTPSSSDDGFASIISKSPSPFPSEHGVRSKRTSIKPLFIKKSAPYSAPYVRENEYVPQYSTLSLDLHDEKQKEQKWEESESDSDAESDYDAVSDWYNEQFNNILTLCSSPPPCSATPPARPDSILSLSPLPALSPAAGTGKSRNSKPLPEIPAVFIPSPQLDPTFPRRKRTVCAASSSRPLPPLPSSPAARSPPRTSVPVDMGFDEVDVLSHSSARVYSQTKEKPVVDGVFELNMDLDMPLGLPLSLPSTPIDPELEFMKLCGSPTKTTTNKRLSVIPEFSEPATPVARSYRRDSELQTQQVQEMDRILRSRWSTSTLSSIDHETTPSASSRLHFLFGSSKKGNSKGHAKFHSLSTPSKKEFNYHSYSPEHERTVRRCASGSSMSTDSSTSSSDSTLSNGLRRKPIPLALLINN